MSAPSERVRVLIADSNYMGSELMANALSHYRNDFEVVGIASSSHDTLHKVQACNPHVALLSPGWGHGDHTGFRVMQKMRNAHPRTTLVMLLQSPDRESVVDAFRAGARGVFSRSDSVQSLAKCIRCVHNGEIWASNAQIEFLLQALPQPRPSLTQTKGVRSLTPREREVSRLVEEGKKNREIAETLGVTEHTVSNYLYRIFEKLEVTSRVQLILYAQTPQNLAES